MKTMMSVLFVTIMAFALVSSCEAAWFSSSNDNPGAISANYNTPGNANTKDADRLGNMTDGTPFPCGAEPAYLDYTDARAVPCSQNTKSSQTPAVMGTWH